MSAPYTTVRGVRIPRLVYGTAWKEERTAALTRLALESGFRGIDTANQRRHYFEAAVGEALQAALDSGTLGRDDVFVQTKFTFLNGHDHRLPYDPKAPVREQVAQSFESSLAHLGLDRVDSYVLHGPSMYSGLGPADWEAWQAMEDLQRAGRTRLIGVSNVSFGQLETLCSKASVKPAVVQNRTFTRPNADAEVRQFCERRSIAYEGFSLLTGNPFMARHPLVHEIAAHKGKTVAQVILRYCLDAGIVVLTGTTSAEHMTQDLAIHDFELDLEEREALARLEPHQGETGN